MPLKPIVTRDDLTIIGRFLVQELQREIGVQKHIATGTLQDSFEYKITNAGNNITLEIWSEDYGQYVNDGRKPGARRVPIAALMDWIKAKAIASDDKEVKRIAFAIQEKIYREGIPTSNSKKLAPRRLNHLEFVIEATQSQTDRLMNERVQDNIRRQLDQAFADAQMQINKAA